jgi:hypothetical protein
VLLRELFIREATAQGTAVKKKLGRAFNHLEDLVFFHGSQGALEALQHLEEIGNDSSSVRMKWDGAPQVYWGRTQDGTFILANHNGWLRGGKGTSDLQDFTSSRGIYNFILNKSGSPKTPDEEMARKEFAANFSHLYDIFKEATPEQFRGFVYADALFLNPPEADADGVYNLNPNPKSKTVYHISQATELGQRIAQAQVMVVGHGTFDSFGADDSAQKPKTSFEEFNSNPALIVLGPTYTQIQPKIDPTAISSVKKYVMQHGANVDTFLQPIPGVSGFKDIMYRYINTMSKQGQLHNVANNFINWVETGGVVSAGQSQKIKERATQYPSALPVIFKLFTDLMNLKNSIIAQLDKDPGEIKATNGEGWVRYAEKGKSLGNVKFVPRTDIDTPHGTKIPAWIP